MYRHSQIYGLNVLLTTLVKAIGILLDDSLPAINHAEVARGLIRLFLHVKAVENDRE